MLRLIVTDMDGTLLPYGERTLSPAIRDLLLAHLEKGREVAVSSGRTYGELKDLMGDLTPRLWFICCDGAYTVKGDRLFYERGLEGEALATLFRSVKEEQGASMMLHGAFRNYSVGQTPPEAEVFRATPVKRKEELREKIFKVTLWGTEKRPASMSYLRMHWDGGVRKQTQYVCRFADKGAALSDLQVRLMLMDYDTACLGDSDNDTPMMRPAVHSFCVGDRSGGLLSHCRRHVATAEEALRQLLEE